MPAPHSRRVAAIASTLGAVVAVTGAALTAAPAASAASGTVTIASTLPSWLAKATPAATPAATTRQSVRVYLTPHGGLAALQATVADLSNPASANYRHWLTTAQYDARFAPTSAAAGAVSSYLTGKGLVVTGVEAHRRYVSATGTAAQLGTAFGTTLAGYAHDGQTVVANKTAAVLPAAVGAQVLTVTGLDTTTTTMTHHDVTPDAVPPGGFVNGRPCSVYYDQLKATYEADYQTPLPQFMGQTLSYAPCGYTGPQFRATYEAGLRLAGQGATVAITDAYQWQFIARDAETYATNNGDGSYTAGQLTQVASPTGYRLQKLCDPSGWSGEETLDVEAVHAMAPQANIRYYGSASCITPDFIDTLARVVDDNKAQLVSNSWGDAGEQGEQASDIAAQEQVLLQGATQGISFLFSSGDNGDELANTGVKQADYPASDPYVTAVGGTATGIANTATGPQIVTQTGWGTQNYSLSADATQWIGTGFLYGAGGGNSKLFNQPTYQQGVVPSSNGSGRAVPDVAMDADPNTGMLIGQTQTFPDGVRYGEYRIGGTSLASPLLAGFMALAVGKTGSGFGLLNPLIYSAAAKNFADVTPVRDLGVVRVNNVNGVDPSDGVTYLVRTFDQDSSLATAAGWDPVTGRGVPKAAFLAALAGGGATS